MFEFKNLLQTILGTKSPIADKFLRVKIKEIPYNKNLIKSTDLLSEFNIFEKKYKIHPIWWRCEVNENLVTVFFANETTKKKIDNHILLDKQNLASNDIHQIVGKGFSKTYDLNKANDEILLKRFLSGVTRMPPQQNQAMDDALEIDYQDLNLLEQCPFLLKSIVVQGYTLCDTSFPKTYIKQHSVTIKKANKTNYRELREEHLKRSMDHNLNSTIQNQHKHIYNNIDFIKNLPDD